MWALFQELSITYSIFSRVVYSSHATWTRVATRATIFLTFDLTCYTPEWLATWLGLATKYLRLDLYLRQNTWDLTWTWSKWLATFFKSRNFVNISRIESATKQAWAQSPALACMYTNMIALADSTHAGACPTCIWRAHTQLFNQWYNICV